MCHVYVIMNACSMYARICHVNDQVWLSAGTASEMCHAAWQGGERSVVLHPGPNRLAFQVTVLKQGLYTLKHMHARLGRLSMSLRTALPDEEGPPVELLTAPPMTPVLSEAQGLAQQPAIGEIDALGRPPLGDTEG